MYNILFFIDHGDFLAFQASDSTGYRSIAENMAKAPIKTIFSKIPWYLGNDDKGFVVYAGLLYRLIPSNLTLNFFNLFLNLATVTLIYKIGKFILSEKGAFLSALIFGLATYTVFYQASGLKESLMVFLTVGAFYFFIRSFESLPPSVFFLALLCCLLLVFFRVPIAFFLLISGAIYLFFKKKGTSMLGPPIIFFSLIIGIVFLVFFDSYLIRYTYSIDKVIAIKETVFQHNLRFAGLVSTVSGLFGPFPTLIPFPGKENTSIFGGSLILKIFISAYFFVGAYFAYKSRDAIALSLAMFCLLEIVGLCYLMETMELRKSFPHIAFFVLIAIYGFENLEKQALEFAGLTKLIFAGNLSFAIAIPAWNILRF